MLFFIALCLSVPAAQGQSSLRKANAFYEEGAYAEAIRMYNRHLKRGEDLNARLNLARSYRAVGKLKEAESSYGRVVSHADSKPGHMFELGKLYKAMGKYEKAKTWFEKYAAASPDASLGQKWAASCDNVINIKKDSLGYKIIKNAAPNTKYSEIGPVFYKGGVAYASSRKRGFLFRFFNPKTNLPFYDMYVADGMSGGRLRKGKLIRNNLNTRFHDGPAIFTPSEHIGFITRSKSGENGGRRDAAGYNRVNLYKVENKLDRWRKGEPLPFNSNEYNVAHPAITRDGGTLIFASDMPGGYGGTDLYISFFVNGDWTTPENLGAEVNTEANEGYP
ncbi:MAG: tetratricopeptide repeat protein, partial [Bacteroidota bacterium]